MNTALLAKAGVAAAACATAFLVNTGTAHAATWDGTDPAMTGCDSGAYTAKSAYARDGQGAIQALIELRYSPHCRTTWARITTVNMPNCISGVDYCGTARVHRNSDGKTYTCPIRGGDHGCYTPQVNDAGVTSYAEGGAEKGAWSSWGRTPSW